MRVDHQRNEETVKSFKEHEHAEKQERRKAVNHQE